MYEVDLFDASARTGWFILTETNWLVLKDFLKMLAKARIAREDHKQNELRAPQALAEAAPHGASTLPWKGTNPDKGERTLIGT